MEHLIGLLWWFMNQGGDIEGTPAVYTQRRAQLIAIVYNIKAHLASFDSKYYFEGLRAVTFQIVSTCLTVNLLNYYNYIYKKVFKIF